MLRAYGKKECDISKNGKKFSTAGTQSERSNGEKKRDGDKGLLGLV